MPSTISTCEPIERTAGDSWRWDVAYADYPASDGWELHYVLTGAAAEPVEIAAATAADGVSYEVRVDAATTGAYTPGRYDLVGYVTDGTDRFLVYRGPLVVLPDPVTASPQLSFNERMLVALEAKIEARVAADISGYTLEQQAVQREELQRLQSQRNAYAEAVRLERGGSPGRSVQVRFG